MKELNFDTGLVTYRVNGKCEITFNPTDIGFIGRLFDAFEVLAKRQDAIDAENTDVSGAELLALARERDKEMRAEIDAVFGEPVCGSIFGSQSVYAIANGVPLWCNFLMAIIDEADASVQSERKKTTPRMEKYMAKYEKRRKK